MATTRVLSSVLIAFACASAPARAGLYQFTIEGEVTYTVLPHMVAIGDPVTIRYVADSQDLLPHLPTVGEYAVTNATVTFPNVTFVTRPGPGTSLLVERFETLDSVRFVSHGDPYGILVAMSFPGDTPASDELPLALPVPSANIARFHMFPAITDIICGEITSYASAEVPESSGAILPLLPAMLLASRHRRSMRRIQSAARARSC